MKQYLNLLEDILNEGTYKPSARENMPGTYSLFGEQMKFDLSKGFPMVTTKKVSFKNIVTELLWFLKGDTNIKYLVDNGCNIWNEDAYNYYRKILKKHDFRGKGYSFEEFILTLKEQGTVEIVGLDQNTYKLGDCGKQYGWLWRDYNGTPNIFDETGDFIEQGIEGIDQLKDLIEGLKANPMGRRHIITAWNPATLDDMALNACHAFVQFNCRPLTLQERHGLYLVKGQPSHVYANTTAEDMNLDHVPQYYLDCQLYQRSADVVLGVPFNIASYALLTEIIAKICNMIPGTFVHTFGDVHIYENHIEAVKEQLQREPKKLPKIKLSDKIDWDFTLEENFFENLNINDFQLENYESYPKLQNETKLSTGLL